MNNINATIDYDTHLGITNELREGQMHLAQELEAKDAEIAALKAEVRRLIVRPARRDAK